MKYLYCFCVLLRSSRCWNEAVSLCALDMVPYALPLIDNGWLQNCVHRCLYRRRYLPINHSDTQ